MRFSNPAKAARNSWKSRDPPEPSAETVRWRALDNARGMLIAEAHEDYGNTQKARHYELRKSANGRTDQYDVFQNKHLTQTAGPREIEPRWLIIGKVQLH